MCGVLIFFLGYLSQYLVLNKRFTLKKKIDFNLLLLITLKSYFYVVFSNPGNPIPNFHPDVKQWKRWCQTCQNYKPERSYHCKTCNKCILMMDHHCLWINNCIGYYNILEFFIFIFFLSFSSFFLNKELIIIFIEYYDNRDLPAYYLSKVEVVFNFISFFVNSIVLILITFFNFHQTKNLLNGMTRVEELEYDNISKKLHTKAFENQLYENFELFYDKKNKLLSSSKENKNNNRHNSEKFYTKFKSFYNNPFFLDFIFPYDIGFWENITVLFPAYLTFPKNLIIKSNGHHFNKSLPSNEIALPWPPNLYHQHLRKTI